jgi:hypothetical protein
MWEERMMKRGSLCVSVVLVAAILSVSNAISAEKAEKVTKEQLAGEWKHTPGERNAFLLRADGSGILHSYLTGKVECTWDFNEHYQTLSLATRQVQRQYKAKLEEGKIQLYDGRNVWVKGATMNAPLNAPLDKALKVEKAAEKAEGKAAEKPAKTE